MQIEEHIYARPVGEFCRREVVFCDEADLVQTVAAVMAQRGISSALVCRHGEPVGIFTDRDLRKKVVALGADPGSLPAAAIMNAPLVTVGAEDFLFEAVYRMSRHGIHRIAVLDAAGKVCGMLTESDLIRLQTTSPQLLVRQLEGAQSLADLQQVHAGIEKLALALHQVGVPTHDLMRLISHLNDQIIQRLIGLLRRDRFPQLFGRFALVVLGSEGRGEQTLKSDQDNALIHADDLTAAELVQLEAFATALAEGLAAVGIPECSGGMMAKNPFWRRSLGDWLQVVDQWIAEPDGENILHFCMLCDLRTVAGDAALEQALKAHIARRARESGVLLVQLAARVQQYPPPLGWFGGFKVEKAGEFRGQVDLKTAGLFAITEGVRVLGLAAGLVGGGTQEKIAQLRELGVLTPEQAEDLRAGYHTLCRLRLRGQLEAIANGEPLTNHVAPEHFNRVEKGRFLETLKVVKTFEAFINSHFRLDVVPG